MYLWPFDFIKIENWIYLDMTSISVPFQNDNWPLIPSMPSRSLCVHVLSVYVRVCHVGPGILRTLFLQLTRQL